MKQLIIELLELLLQNQKKIPPPPKEIIYQTRDEDLNKIQMNNVSGRKQKSMKFNNEVFTNVGGNIKFLSNMCGRDPLAQTFLCTTKRWCIHN